MRSHIEDNLGDMVFILTFDSFRLTKFIFESLHYSNSTPQKRRREPWRYRRGLEKCRTYFFSVVSQNVSGLSGLHSNVRILDIETKHCPERRDV